MVNYQVPRYGGRGSLTPTLFSLLCACPALPVYSNYGIVVLQHFISEICYQS